MEIGKTDHPDSRNYYDEWKRRGIDERSKQLDHWTQVARAYLAFLEATLSKTTK